MLQIDQIIKQLLANPQGIASPDGVKIGYARVSTDDQKMDLQIDALKRDGVDADRIFQETISGASRKRPEFENVKRALRPGDTLVVWKLDRVGRRIVEVLTFIESLDRAKIGFRSLTEAIDTGTAAGRLMMHMIAAFAEFERGMTVERTKAGMKARAARGLPVGAPRRIDLEKVDALLRDGKTIADVARHIGYSRAAVARYRTQADAERLFRAGLKNKPTKKTAPKRRK